MNYQTLMKAIRAGDIHPIYLFTGQEKKGAEMYLAGMMEQMLVKKCIAPGLEPFNVTVFSDKSPDISEIIAVCETMPMLSGKRVVVVKESTGLTHSADKQMVERLSRYLQMPSPNTVLIFYDTTPDKRKKIYKVLKETAVLVEYGKLSQLELEKWIGRRVDQAGKTITQGAMAAFLEHSLYLENDSQNLEQVDNEINKLIDYAGNETQISKQAVELVMPRSIEDDIFKMVDYATNGNKGAALKMLRQFYLEGESAFGVFGLLLRQIRILLQVRLLKERYASAEAIAKQAKLRPFVVRKALRSPYSVEKLKHIMIDAADLDLKMKTGKIEPEFGVEWFILKL